MLHQPRPPFVSCTKTRQYRGPATPRSCTNPFLGTFAYLMSNPVSFLELPLRRHRGHGYFNGCQYRLIMSDSFRGSSVIYNHRPPMCFFLALIKAPTSTNASYYSLEALPRMLLKISRISTIWAAACAPQTFIVVQYKWILHDLECIIGMLGRGLSRH